MGQNDESDWSRRAVLKLLGLAGGFLLPGLGGCGDDDGAASGGGTGVERVIIVGAGFAGLTAAQCLRHFGIPAVIVEARDRIGGRLWTPDIGGVPVDLGGAWIHGPEGNPVACLATSLGIGWKEAEIISSSLSVFDPRHGFLPGRILLDLASLTERFDEALPGLKSQFPDGSFAEAARSFLDAQGLSGDPRRYADFVLRQGTAELFYGGPASLMSLASTNADEEYPGGNHFPNGGYTGLVQAMAEGVEIHLGRAVSEVIADSRGATVVAGGQTLRGSHVLSTLPLGVLKAGHVRFYPTLPVAKRQAIERLDMGNFEKVVLRFDEAFWLTRRRLQFAYLSETYGEFPIFFDLTRYLGQPTLLCFYGGTFARQADAFSDDTVRRRVLEILAQVFQAEIPSPTHFVRTRWSGDPYSLGSYSYLPVGASEEDMRVLGEPQGRLLFAGEATDPKHYGTVPAAMLSGIREAQRLRVLAGLPEPVALPAVLRCGAANDGVVIG